MPLESIRRDCKERMDKTVEYLGNELRGIRTGRATTALVDYVKIEYYGSPTDLRELAAVSVPEPTKIVIKPFDPTVKGEIAKALESADLGLNPQVEGDSIRVTVPAPSAERRKQLVAQVRKMAEEARVAIRNERRDAIKRIDAAVKDKDNHISEDVGSSARDAIEELTKKHVASIDEQADKKAIEVEDI